MFEFGSHVPTLVDKGIFDDLFCFFFFRLHIDSTAFQLLLHRPVVVCNLQHRTVGTGGFLQFETGIGLLEGIEEGVDVFSIFLFDLVDSSEN